MAYRGLHNNQGFSTTTEIYQGAYIPADQIAAQLQLECEQEAAKSPASVKVSVSSSERPAEDMYAQELEDSTLWAKSSDDGLIYRWTGCYWEVVAQEAGEKEALLWLRRHYPKKASARCAADCYRTARLTMPQLPPVPFGRCLIPCLDGWLEMWGHRFVRIAPDKSIGVTHAIKTHLGHLRIGDEYIPGQMPAPESGSLFANYLHVSLPDLEVRALVQEYVGYTLLPHSFLNLQVAMICIGNGADGKGVLTNLMRRLHQHVCAMNFRTTDGFGAEGLIGATLAVIDEGGSRHVIDEERIKTMISGDALDINRKHKSVVTYAPVAKWIINANDTPRFSSASQAIRRRFLYAPWTASLGQAQRIPNLEARIAATELKVVLDWALAGASALVKRGDFVIPTVSSNLQEESMRAIDTVLGWKDEANPQVFPTAQTPKDTIYHDYVTWCHNQGQYPVAAVSFWKNLRKYLGVTNDELKMHKLTVKPNTKPTLTVPILIYQAPCDPNEKHPFG